MSRPQCPRCLRPISHCLCALIPSLDSRTRVLLLQHPSEVNHALNTARLAALGLINAQLVVGEVFEDLAGLLNPMGYQARLLFPGDDAQPLQPSAPSDTPLLLVVPDGTWRKVRKMLYLNPLLAALPRVALSAQGVSRYRLRKAPGPGALSTVEAVAQALQILEAPTSYAALLKPFDALIEGQISAMGTAVYEKNHS